MRILYVIDALAVWGGLERVLCDKMNYLVANFDYEVYVVTTDQGKHPIPFPLDERVRYYDFNINFYRQYKYYGLKRLFKYRELNRIFMHRLKDSINTIKPDVIVSTRLSFLSQIIKKKGSIPLLYESHSMCYGYKFEKNYFAHRLKMLLALRKIRHVDTVVALTEGDAKDWHNYSDNVVVIPNVIQSNETSRLCKHDSKIVIFVGRFVEQKGLWILIDIWKRVHSRYPDWELHAYGEGNLMDAFKLAASKTNANIKVFQPTTDIFNKYLDSSMLIMTSKYEPFGLVLPEAMSCGLPVIAFNCPYGPASIIKDGEDGFLIECYNKDMFASRICQLIDNPSLRQLMGKAALTSAYQFQATHIMPRWRQLYDSVAKKNTYIEKYDVQ